MEYKVKSDYTRLRKKKQRLTNGGDVYENDYMTISPMDDLFPDDQEILPSSGNFKFSVRYSQNTHKRHARRNWLRTSKGEEVWTLGDVENSSISNESIIRIKPDYTRLTDFAYYGSAVEMVRAAVNNVVLNFPAEIFFSGDEFPLNPYADKKYYLIHNGYGINADITSVNNTNIDNPLRYLCVSSSEYDYFDKDGNLVSSEVTFDITRQKLECSKYGGIIAKCTIKAGDTEFIIYTWKKDDDKWLIYEDASYHGASIRPCQEAIDNYFNSIDDFEYILLNRDSKPIYKSTFETPIENETGVSYTIQDYIWPSYNNWNPDIDSGLYGRYIADLIAVASYYDEYDTNNMWRQETHEAIKNLDWTFFRENGDTVEDMSKIDSSKIEAIIQIYGRAFDGIRRYINNIKNINNISYNEKNNLPDYHLTDVVELSGWEAYTINPTAQTSTVCENMYGGRTKGWNATESNIAFMRNLKINSRYIQSLKGTRHGIHALLGLLGLKPEEYTINEKVMVLEGKGNYCDFEKLYKDIITEGEPDKSCTAPLFKNVAGINIYRENNGITDDSYGQDFLYGLALRMNTAKNTKGEIYRYCTPWFDSHEMHDGDWYFQCDGGWGKRITKKIDAPDLTNIKELNSYESQGFTIYEESEGYLRYVQDLDELINLPNKRLTEGEICYVTDVIGLIDRYEGDKSVILNDEELSHYFILKNAEHSTILGDGWVYIKIIDIRNAGTIDALKVIYLETLKEQTEGNNPHFGKGKYDDGKRYKDHMSFIFKHAYENDGLNRFTANDIEAIKGYQFSSKEYTDNKKCWYFSDMENNYVPEGGKTKNGATLKLIDKTAMGVPNNDFKYDGDTTVTEGATTIEPKSFITTQGDYSERAADSVVNLKNIEFVFHYPCDLAVDQQSMWEDYIDNVVIEYLKQIIPSTTIWGYMVDGGVEGCETPVPPRKKPLTKASPYQTTDEISKSNFVDGVSISTEDISDGMDAIESTKDNIIKK